MGLSTRLVIVKGTLDCSPEEFVKQMGFKISSHAGTNDILGAGRLGNNYIAIGTHNNLVYIAHQELPMYLIEPEFAQDEYPYSEARDRIQNLAIAGRFVSVIFQSSINGFGYSIHQDNHYLRSVCGDYEKVFLNEGKVQVEESLLNNALYRESGKVEYNGKQYSLHEIGTEITHETVNNYCGKDFLVTEMVMNVWKIKI